MRPDTLIFDGSESDFGVMDNPMDLIKNSYEDSSSGAETEISLCKDCLQDQDKDSGIEYSGIEESFVTPDQELMTKIINQVEFYFSNENILKDPFLLKHVRRNKEGYVSLKLIATFRKVKTFTKDWNVVAHSLRHSARLEVNEQNTKVRRVDPLPEHDETTPSRTIVVHNLPFEKVTMETVGDLVSKYGDVVLIRILRPGVVVPSDMKELKKFLVKHPDLSDSVCAAIEFEKQQSASAALKDLNSKDWRGVRAFPLVDKSEVTTGVQSTPVPVAKPAPRKDSIRNAPNKKRKNKKPVQKTMSTSSCSESEQFSPEIRRRSSGSISSGYISSSPRVFSDYFMERRNSGGSVAVRQQQNSPASVRRPHLGRPVRSMTTHSLISASSPIETECSSPWVQRRMMAAREASCATATSTPHSRTLVPEGVIRMPYGPDGSKGFHKTRRVTVA